jgi:hypothetical protein
LTVRDMSTHGKFAAGYLRSQTPTSHPEERAPVTSCVFRHATDRFGILISPVALSGNVLPKALCQLLQAVPDFSLLNHAHFSGDRSGD